MIELVRRVAADPEYRIFVGLLALLYGTPFLSGWSAVSNHVWARELGLSAEEKVANVLQVDPASLGTPADVEQAFQQHFPASARCDRVRDVVAGWAESSAHDDIWTYPTHFILVLNDGVDPNRELRVRFDCMGGRLGWIAVRER